MCLVFVLYSPEQMGLLDPDTSDGRVIFFLPWLKHTIAGTTDLPCQVTHNPKPTEDEILFILEEVKNYLNPDVEGESLLHRLISLEAFCLIRIMCCVVIVHCAVCCV